MMQPVSLAISEDARIQLVALLNQQLADVVTLTGQLKQAHWNVKGIHFYTFHKLFDDVYENLEPYIDDVAERIVQLGGVAQGTVRDAAQNTNIPALPEGAFTAEFILPTLVRHYAQVTNNMRNALDVADDLDDDVTEDLLTEILRKMEKDLWFLEAHLQQPDQDA